MTETRFFDEVVRETGIHAGPEPGERIPPATVSDALERDYALTGRLTRIDTEKDDTFRLDAATGRLLVKVAPAAEDPRIVELQTAAMTHLEQHATGVRTQGVVPALHGGRHSLVVDPSGRERVLRVLTFVEGRIMEEVAATSEQLRCAGAVLARLDRALAGFRHPRADRLLLWDLTLFPRMRHLVSYVDDAADQRLAYDVFDRFDDTVAAIVPSLETQVIHGDFSPHNVVVDPDAPGFVTGVIDFGDVVRAPLLFELSVPVANLLGADPRDPWAAATEVVGGYSREHDLGSEVLGLLACTAPARLLLRALIYGWRSQGDPRSREYAVSHSAHDWQRLRSALAVDHDHVRERLAAARPHQQP